MESDEFGYTRQPAGGSPKPKAVKDKSLDNNLNVDIMLKHSRTGSGSSRGSTSSKDPSSEKILNTTPKPKVEEIKSEAIQLPQRFVVKYLGYRETTNLWGIKYTRKPVDEMVAEAKRSLSLTGKPLPLLKLEVTEDGITVGPMPQNTNPIYPNGRFAIETISYGVQDLVYTRVFAMIVVKPENPNPHQQHSSKPDPSINLSELSKSIDKISSNSNTNLTPSPFRCHGFVTDTRETAKNLTYALASAFQKFSEKVTAGKIKVPKPRKFAIDLRSTEEIEADLQDSEA